MTTHVATSIAIALGCVAGGGFALIHSPDTGIPAADEGIRATGISRLPGTRGSAPRPDRSSPRSTSAVSASRPVGYPSNAPPTLDLGPSAGAKANGPAGSRRDSARLRKASADISPSPHDHPVEDESELGKAERLCIRDVPDECVRVADAYIRGAVVEPNRKRAAQYRNLAFKAYIRLCESNAPEACYALARMYLHGDGVKANPAYAQNLMKRVVEVCSYKRRAICARLAEEAPVPAQRR